MNKIIEFIKRIFKKNTLALNEGSIKIEEKIISHSKDSFLNDIKINNGINKILSLQIKLEQGIIDENDLNSDQIIEIKKLYCNQIGNIVNKINNYKLKLNKI